MSRSHYQFKPMRAKIRKDNYLWFQRRGALPLSSAEYSLIPSDKPNHCVRCSRLIKILADIFHPSGSRYGYLKYLGYESFRYGISRHLKTTY